MLLLMTEVFDLKTRNQWLRRRIITLVRQIMHAMFGDIVNRRILEYVAAITSPSRVALYLANVKYVRVPYRTVPHARTYVYVLRSLFNNRVASQKFHMA